MNENLEKAKRLFFDYSCSRYFMAHDGADVEYKLYDVPEELEIEWRKEYVAYWTKRLSLDNFEAMQSLDHAWATEALPDLMTMCNNAEGYAKLKYAEVIWRLATGAESRKEIRQRAIETAVNAWKSLTEGSFTIPEHHKEKIQRALPRNTTMTSEEYVINQAKRQLDLANQQGKL